ncbi:MAG: hypothetical protein AAF226_06360 [Verrucomicrobiota bacterium]
MTDPQSSNSNVSSPTERATVSKSRQSVSGTLNLNARKPRDPASQLREQIKNLQATLSKTQQEAKVATDSVTSWKSAYSTLSERHQTDLTELNKRIETAEKDRDHWKQKFSELKSARTDVTKRVEKLNDKFLLLKAEKAEIQSQKEAESHKNLEQQSQLADLKSEKARLENEVAELKRQAVTAADECEYWKEYYSTAYHLNEETSQKLDGASTEINDLSSQVLDKSSQIEEAKEFIDRLVSKHKQEVGTLQTQLADWQDSYNQLKAQYDQLISQTEIEN